MSAVITEAEVHIPLDERVDFEAELERLTREKKKLEGEVKRGEKMLSNEGFISKAPEAKIQQEKDKLANYKDMLAKVEERLDIIKNKIK
jgi:valyl-tRNA synthetase